MIIFGKSIHRKYNKYIVVICFVILSFSTSTTPSQNTDLEINVSGHTFRIGTYNNSGDFFSGYLTEVVFCDGQWGDGSGNWDEASPNNYLSITDPASVALGAYFPAHGDWSSGTIGWEVNFGNPVHSISSANSDANGYGSFEFSVPSGYYSLCSKNLAEYG